MSRRRDDESGNPWDDLVYNGGQLVFWAVVIGVLLVIGGVLWPEACR